MGLFFEAMDPFVWGDFILGPYVLTMGPAGLGLILDYFLDPKPD